MNLLNLYAIHVESSIYPSKAAHKDIVHENISPPEFTCDECDKLFSNRSHLNRHMKAAHSDVVKVNIEIVDSVDKALEVKCPQCDKQFRSCLLYTSPSPRD